MSAMTAAAATVGRFKCLRFAGKANGAFQRSGKLQYLNCRNLRGESFKIACSSSSNKGNSDKNEDAQSASADNRRSEDDTVTKDEAPKGFGQAAKPSSANPPGVTDAVIQCLEGVSRAEGRNAKTRNVVMGSTSDWDILDAQVNEYPQSRAFKAIGPRGEDFVASIRAAAESVLGPLPERAVSLRASRDGNYVTVSVGPVQRMVSGDLRFSSLDMLAVTSAEQVKAVYGAMKQDERVRFFL